MTPAAGAIRRVWMVGCGNMGGAMLRRWLGEGALAADDISVVNRSDRDLSVRQARDLPDGQLPDAVILATKPQQLDEIADRFARRLAGVPLLLSILAGVEESALADRFTAEAIVRAMPNLPVAIGRGVVALESSGADVPTRAAVAALMAPLGLIEWVATAHFDVVTALAGSGPAFLYRFVDALAQGAAARGLPPDQAARLALATVEGAALLAAAADIATGDLADRVASPGGSTRAGLDVLDRDGALIALLTGTIAAAARRNTELAVAARR